MNLPIAAQHPLQPAPPATPAEPRHDGGPPRLVKACQDFEAIFLRAIFKEMRSTAIDGGLFEKNNGQEMFEELMDMELADLAAARNTLGLGQVLLRELQQP